MINFCNIDLWARKSMISEVLLTLQTSIMEMNFSVLYVIYSWLAEYNHFTTLQTFNLIWGGDYIFLVKRDTVIGLLTSTVKVFKDSKYLRVYARAVWYNLGDIIVLSSARSSFHHVIARRQLQAFWFWR